jgi:purine-nucleoside phosphorylase
MSQFEALFGIRKSQVKKSCILLPLLHKLILREFKVRKISRGKLFGSGNANDFTLIHTGLGPSLVGDAVLYLKETPCQNIVLFGSCGLVTEKEGLSIGSLVSPFKCYANESFSEMLLESNIRPKAFYAHGALLEKFLNAHPNAHIRKVTCSTVSSLKLEEDFVGSFLEKEIEVVDMECSAFFSAANFTGLNAMALFYITDIIKEKPFYRDLGPILKLKLFSSIKNAVNLLCEFMKMNSSA